MRRQIEGCAGRVQRQTTIGGGDGIALLLVGRCQRVIRIVVIVVVLIFVVIRLAVGGVFHFRIPVVVVVVVVGLLLVALALVLLELLDVLLALERVLLEELLVGDRPVLLDEFRRAAAPPCPACSPARRATFSWAFSLVGGCRLAVVASC